MRIRSLTEKQAQCQFRLSFGEQPGTYYLFQNKIFLIYSFQFEEFPREDMNESSKKDFKTFLILSPSFLANKKKEKEDESE